LKGVGPEEEQVCEYVGVEVGTWFIINPVVCCNGCDEKIEGDLGADIFCKKLGLLVDMGPLILIFGIVLLSVSAKVLLNKFDPDDCI
jgi:hypothetical protein